MVDKKDLVNTHLDLDAELSIYSFYLIPIDLSYIWKKILQKCNTEFKLPVNYW